MGERATLTKNLDENTFRNGYYLKEELVEFCKENSLPTGGSKAELTERIAVFLKTGEVCARNTASKKKASIENESIGECSLIEDNFVCSQKHRAFFENIIGKSFSFNVRFQKWLKANAGKTYKDAIEAYKRIAEDKKNGKEPIDNQFEYNQYIRDFFEDNRDKSLEEAIICWKYKKSILGHNRYERSDLAVLNSAESVPYEQVENE